MKKNLYKMIAALAAIAGFNGVLPAAVNIGVTPGSWDIGTGANGEYTSPQFTIANNGEPVRVNIKASNSPDWRLSNTARLNAFSIKWRDTGDWSDIFTNDTTMFPHLASASQQPFTLKYLSPTYAIPPVNGTPQASNVTLTAVSSYMGNTWNINGAALGGYTNGAVIAKDAVGDFHIAFGSSSPNHLMYSDMGGVPEVVPVTLSQLAQENGYSINSVTPIALTMDTNGRPHMIYWVTTSNGDHQLQYAWRNGSTWVTRDVFDGAPVYRPDNSQVAFSLDTNNLPHLVCATGNPYGQLDYIRYSGSEWITENLPVSNSFGQWQRISMRVGLLNVPHIVYRDYDNSVGYESLYHTTKLNGEWVTKKIVHQGDAVSDLVLDGQNRPYVMAQDWSGNYSFNIYRQNSDGNWVAVCPVPEELSSNGNYYSWNLDSNGYSRVVYGVYQGPFSVLRYAQWTGVEWLSSDILSSYENVGTVVSGFDINDKPIVGYVESHDIPDVGSVYSLNRAKLE